MDFIDNVCSLPAYQHIGIIILVQFMLGFVNLYLSKSEKTKSSSVAEFVFNTFVSMVKRLFKKGQ